MMGYYTSYRIKIFNDLEDKATKALSELSWEAESVLSMSDMNHKWYTREEDVLDVTKQFPEVIIEVEGVGEENGDVWIERYKNGNLERIEPIIIWPKFERIVIEPNNEDSKEENKSGEESEISSTV